MEELIRLIIEVIVWIARHSEKGSKQERARKEWEQQQEFERRKKEFEERVRQLAAGNAPQTATAMQAAVQLPPITRLPAGTGTKRSPRTQPIAAPPPSVPQKRSGSGQMPSPAAAVRGMTLSTLRGQFVLSEVLRPPLALRPPRI
jgi:hypothetical protein